MTMSASRPRRTGRSGTARNGRARVLGLASVALLALVCSLFLASPVLAVPRSGSDARGAGARAQDRFAQAQAQAAAADARAARASRAREADVDRIHLSQVRALSFYNRALTRSRRTRPIEQMTCRGKPCGRYQPDVISCVAIGAGYDGRLPEWKCQADLPSSIRLGRTQVSCEGWDSPQDEYILKGSCGLEYTLLPAYDADNEGHRVYYERTRLDRVMNMLFWLAFFAAVFMILRSFLAATGLIGRGGGPGGGGGPGRPGWGGGPGGWFSGGGGGWRGGPGSGGPPPPPYSKYEQAGGASSPSPTPQGGQAQGANRPWRPGFWTGLGLGGIAAQLYASANRERERERYHGGWDWERARGNTYDGPAFGAPGGFGAGGYGFGAGGTRGWGAGGYGRASPGPSRRAPSREEIRPSTGFGGTTLR